MVNIYTLGQGVGGIVLLPAALGETSMTALGFDKPLYLLPFDHRGSFQTKLFGWTGNLTADQSAQVATSKQIVYDGFRAAVQMGVPEEWAGILVDEQFGADILVQAKAHLQMIACPSEKSGQQEFTFQYGDDFAAHIEAIQPTFCKVLVRYNTKGDRALNARQAARLKQLSDYLQHESCVHFLFELLVPPTDAQAAADRDLYERDVRPLLMAEAIEELQNAGVEPDVWKVEGLACREDCARVVASARRGGRDRVGCIILGSGADETKVNGWLSVASSVPGFIGFAVGRTTFWQALVDWRQNKITREDAVSQIAQRYQRFVQIFRNKGHVAPRISHQEML